MNLDIIAFAAHPDDIELGMGGTVAKLSNEGYKVGIIDCTEGELSTRGTVENRYKEAEEAGKILNITHRENLKIPDGGVRPEKEYVKRVVTKIREFKPKIIFGPYKNDRHPDHIGASQLIKEAMFFSGTPKFETVLNGELQEAYRPEKLYYFMQTYDFEPSFIVDVTDTFDIKTKAVFAYGTQFHNPESEEPETFISRPGFLNHLKARSEFFGFKIGKDYGEAFYTEESIELDLNFVLKG